MRFAAGVVVGWALATAYYVSRNILHILDDVEYGPDFVDWTDNQWQDILSLITNNRGTLREITDNE